MNTTTIRRERRIPALALSRGFGIGHVYFVEEKHRRPSHEHLPVEAIDAEVLRLRTAVDTAIDQVKQLSPEPDHAAKEPVSHILGVQLLMIDRSPFISDIESMIRSDRVNAGWAVMAVCDRYIQQHSAIRDPHLREKRLDIEDITARVLRVLKGNGVAVNNNIQGSIIVARELRPSTVTELARQHPAGIVTERGGWTSHSSIIAREFGIPMVSGVHDVMRTFAEIDRVMVDGVAGSVILHPDPHTLDHIAAVTPLRPSSVKVSAGATTTLDGVEIVIRANVDAAEVYAEARRNGATGIGLFRSESLIDNARVPSEEEQYDAYLRLAQAGGTAGLKVRTFDLSGDDLDLGKAEHNPALGLRSLRLSLSEGQRFATQVRSLLRAANSTNIDIILPMFAGVADLRKGKAVIDEQKRHLRDGGIPFGDTRLGAMIELPSAVMAIDSIAAELDLLCLGTNDLVQYMLGVDRDNEAVAEWYESLHPAVLIAIEKVVAAGARQNKSVQICGEMAGSPFYVPLLLGLGAREFSMNTRSIAPVRKLLAGISVDACIALADRAKQSLTAEENESLLRDHYLANWRHLFSDGLLEQSHR